MSDFRTAQLEKEIMRMQRTIDSLQRRIGRIECRQMEKVVVTAPPIMGFSHGVDSASVRDVFMEK